jgi:hypothetical protein
MSEGMLPGSRSLRRKGAELPGQEQNRGGNPGLKELQGVGRA